MERIAAYCGTRDVYSNIITSVKALIANSAVDEVHIFIEDDDMGEAMPDIVVFHNMSNQSYFEQDTPNMQQPNDYIKMMFQLYVVVRIVRLIVILVLFIIILLNCVSLKQMNV